MTSQDRELGNSTFVHSADVRNKPAKLHKTFATDEEHVQAHREKSASEDPVRREPAARNRDEATRLAFGPIESLTTLGSTSDHLSQRVLQIEEIGLLGQLYLSLPGRAIGWRL